MGQKQADIKILCWENKGKFEALIVYSKGRGRLKMCILGILDLANILLPSYAKKCLLTGQEQACSRITWLFGWL